MPAGAGDVRGPGTGARLDLPIHLKLQFRSVDEQAAAFVANPAFFAELTQDSGYVGSIGADELRQLLVRDRKPKPHEKAVNADRFSDFFAELDQCRRQSGWPGARPADAPQ